MALAGSECGDERKRMWVALGKMRGGGGKDGEGERREEFLWEESQFS